MFGHSTSFIGFASTVIITFLLIGIGFKTSKGYLIFLGVCLLLALSLISDDSFNKKTGAPLPNTLSLNGIYLVEGIVSVAAGKYACVRPIKILEKDFSIKDTGPKIFVAWTFTENPPPYILFKGKDGWQRHLLSDLPANTNLIDSCDLTSKLSTLKVDPRSKARDSLR